jgi:hypothetical protein
MWSGYREIQAILNRKGSQLIVIEVGSVSGSRRCPASRKGVSLLIHSISVSHATWCDVECTKATHIYNPKGRTIML